jgi:hypothetical protein
MMMVMQGREEDGLLPLLFPRLELILARHLHRREQAATTYRLIANARTEGSAGIVVVAACIGATTLGVGAAARGSIEDAFTMRVGVCINALLATAASGCGFLRDANSASLAAFQRR